MSISRGARLFHTSFCCVTTRSDPITRREKSPCRAQAKVNPLRKDQLGWHTQYDAIVTGHSFLAAEATLFRFEPEIFYDQYLAERISGIGIVRKAATKLVRRRIPQFVRKILARLRSR